MKLLRRRFLHLAAGVAALPFLARLAAAQSYPTRPVHIIVGFPPGAASDITARLIGQRLSERLGQQFIVDNRPGANGNIGTESVARAVADGYTLLMVTSGMASNAALYDNPAFNSIRDIAPVGGVSRIPFVVEVNPSLPVNTVPEFIAYAKANPGKLNFGSSGNGAGSHLAVELFKSMTGVEMLHVPYRGPAQALTDLIAGRVQVMFDVLTSSIAHIKGGEVRALAVTTTTPSEALPGIPTVGEFVPG
jgi:tripartite-type tricarboxylate transporter receptor subunit TctC